MRARQALAGFVVLTLAYVGFLVWADSRNQVFSALPRLVGTLPLLVALSFLSYVVRYARWYWLLFRAGHVTDVARGFIAYLAGFAFTATPGKIGELLRIRYLAPEGVPASRVLGALVYERALDLVVVLGLASLAITRADLFWLAIGFVASFIAVLVVVASQQARLTRFVAFLQTRGFVRVARASLVLQEGLAACRTWINPLDGAIAILAGTLAWSVTTISFAILLERIGAQVPPLAALAIYPLGMLAGAASMLPGGIGSTEAAIVAILLVFGVPLATATLAAVGIRLASLWFAICCGLLAVAALEWRRSHTRAGRPAPDRPLR